MGADGVGGIDPMTNDPSEYFRAVPRDTGRPAYIRRTWAEYEADVDSRRAKDETSGFECRAPGCTNDALIVSYFCAAHDGGGVAS